MYLYTSKLSAGFLMHFNFILAHEKKSFKDMSFGLQLEE